MEPGIKDYAFVGMQTFVTNFEQCLSLAAWIKNINPACLVILGGVHAGNFPERALQSGHADLVVCGEGEKVMVDIVQSLREGKAPEEIPGTITKNEKGPVRHPAAPVVSDPDRLPFPAWDLFYTSKPVPVGHLLTFRGCPFHCANCPVRLPEDGKVREHSIARVITELEHLIDRFGVREVECYDEILTLNRNRTIQLCQEIIRRRMKIRWSCFTKVQLVDREILEAMREAGCARIFYGIGSGVTRLMDVLDSRTDPGEAREKIRLTRKAGITACAAFSLGIPEETLTEALKTLRYALSLPAHQIVFQACVPFPGSRLYEKAKQNGRFLIRDWSDAENWLNPAFLPGGRLRMELKALLKLAAALARIKRFRNKIAGGPGILSIV